MSALLLTLAIVVGVACYGAMAGVSYARALRAAKARCSSCRDGRTCYGGRHDVGAFFTSVFWPVGLPFLLALLVSGGDRRADRERREVADAKHAADLAEHRERESRALAQELRNLGVGE